MALLGFRFDVNETQIERLTSRSMASWHTRRGGILEFRDGIHELTVNSKHGGCKAAITSRGPKEAGCGAHCVWCTGHGG